MATAHPPILMFGAVLAFQTYTYATGATFPFLGFYIVAIPLTAILALLAVPDGVLSRPRGVGDTRRPRRPRRAPGRRGSVMRQSRWRSRSVSRSPHGV